MSPANESGSQPVPSEQPSAAEIEAQLERLSASRIFVKSVRLRRFLRFTVDRALAGFADELKEYNLGRDVFDRGPQYDPRTDSIVRVEAQRLRRKLKQYYEGEGAGDRVHIRFLPGSYVPEFGWRTGPAKTAPDPRARVAVVLPFENLGRDPELNIFCAGVTEEIIHTLSALPGLKVLGVSTTASLKASAEGWESACRRLNVSIVVEGSVRRAGNRLRISVKVIDAAEGYVVWTRRFERGFEDIFALEDEIARALAGALGGNVQIPTPPLPAPGLEAYTLYLKGRAGWDDDDPARCKTSVEDFSRAASLAPGYAPAYTGLAACYLWLALWGWLRPRDAWRKSKAAVLEALRLDPDSADALACLAGVLMRFDWDYEGVADTASRALAINPSCGFAHSMKANAALAQGRFDEALRSFEQALQLDPLSYRTHLGVAVVHWAAGESANAEHWIQLARELRPNAALTTYLLTQVHISAGRYSHAYEASHQLRDAPHHLVLSVRGAACGLSGRTEEAREILRRMVALAQSDYVDPFALATVCLGLQDIDGTFAWLARALEERSPLMAFLGAHPLFASLRADPRFRDLVAAIILA